MTKINWSGRETYQSILLGRYSFISKIRPLRPLRSPFWIGRIRVLIDSSLNRTTVHVLRLIFLVVWYLARGRFFAVLIRLLTACEIRGRRCCWRWSWRHRCWWEPHPFPLPQLWQRRRRDVKMSRQNWNKVQRVCLANRYKTIVRMKIISDRYLHWWRKSMSCS